MLLELKQSDLARDGLDAACAATVALLEHLTTEEATTNSIAGLWKHGRKPKGRVLAMVLALSIDQRKELLAAVSFDLGFVERLDDPNFSFRYPSLDAETQGAGKALLISMYEDVFCHRTGFRFGTDGEANRTTWERAYRDANPGVELCPACAIAMLEPPARQTLVDADHYLPKATYPALSVHGLNLVPLCKSCNSALKGSMDPLSDADGSCGLPDIWFPYIRPGIAEIGLSFDPAQPAGRWVEFSGDVAARARAKRFDALFDLLQRWSALLTAIQQTLPKKLKLLPASPDPEGIRAGLRRFQLEAEEEIPYEPRAFVKSHYYAWAHDDEAAVNVLVSQLGGP